jgi:hydrogenase maturation protein HypF
MNEKLKTREFHIYGLVQGVGFRPFVAFLAKKHALGGWVRNAGGIVTVRVTGEEGALVSFAQDVQKQAPAGSRITKLTQSELPIEKFGGFRIEKSSMEEEGASVIPPDLPLCEDCKKELYDPADRRFKNPFISCVACGPRYSIMDALPYDRQRTAMDAFVMCGACALEYRAGGRRDFAQTISCNGCGPQLIFKDKETKLIKEAAFEKAVRVLKSGGVLAIKGIGGYHFACSPFNANAVRRLRELKQRDKKPFAVMFKSAKEIGKYCGVLPAEEELLRSAPRPIVLLPCSGEGLAPEVCAESRYLGAFLPYTPLQELLMDALGPLVMTSANSTDQPILKDDADVLAIRSGFLDGVLYNTRRINVRQDDPVMRVAAGKKQVIRRGRGMVPLPVLLPVCTEKTVFAAGSDMKAAFCLLAGDRAYMSQHLGDMENADAFDNYRENARHMQNLLSVRLETAACDLHPDYFSTRYAQSLGLPVIRVQHHHAHIASVCAEHGIMEDVIGVAFDGTGYGEDGAVWGGEFLVCREGGYERAAHLEYLPIAGGDRAAKDAKLCALSYGIAAKKDDPSGDGRMGVVRAAARSGAAQVSSSMGRLFDAVSALLGVKEVNSFEGECAIALENLAWRALEAGTDPYPLRFELREADGMIFAGQVKLAGEVMDAAREGADKSAVALGFHRAAARMVKEVCCLLREQTGIRIAALSGGVFANRLLLEDVIARLEKSGFDVYVNEQVPMNDGGTALGQAFIAAIKNGSKGK